MTEYSYSPGEIALTGSSSPGRGRHTALVLLLARTSSH